MTRPLRYASELGTSGYAVAAQRCLRALQAAGVDLAWQPLVDAGLDGRVVAPAGTAIPPTLAGLCRDRRDDETLVLHSVPRGWRHVVAELRPAHVIGHAAWEADRLSARWTAEMAGADELWVPTEWNRQAFADALGVPVHVVPHAVTTVMPEAPPCDLPEGDFVVAMVSAWEWRKRPDLTIAAFARAFRKDDPVVLVVKATPFPTAWPWGQRVATVAHIAEVLRPYPDHGRVLIDTGDWSEGQVLGLLRRADCFLSLTAAEGWGLGAFDAACLGTPVLITGHGGQLEWLGDDHPGLLPFRTVPADHPDPALFEPGMTWAEADVRAAAEHLRAVLRGELHGLAAATARLATELPERFSPAAVGARAASLLPA